MWIAWARGLDSLGAGPKRAHNYTQAMQPCRMRTVTGAGPDASRDALHAAGGAHPDSESSAFL